MKHFTGTTDEELRAYLAVITTSVVKDLWRRQRALKRPLADTRAHILEDFDSSQVGRGEQTGVAERQILAREVEGVGCRIIKHSRDRAIFRLYFFEGLSARKIARQKDIGLSKTGVEKILRQVTDRIRSAVVFPS